MGTRLLKSPVFQGICDITFWAIFFKTKINPLTLELNPSAQSCLPRYFIGDFNFLTAHCATSL
jgi:hypothetical protein